MCDDGTKCNHTTAHQEYEKALRRAFWTQVNDRVRRRCNDLVPFGRVLSQIGVLKHYSTGIQEILLAAIVGSSGRYNDFDLRFLPRRKDINDRWVNIAQAHYDGVQLPPVQVYKIGDAYYVNDGNHRVSVARVLGNETINAVVTEIDPSDLVSDASCNRVGYITKS